VQIFHTSAKQLTLRSLVVRGNVQDQCKQADALTGNRCKEQEVYAVASSRPFLCTWNIRTWAWRRVGKGGTPGGQKGRKAEKNLKECLDVLIGEASGDLAHID